MYGINYHFVNLLFLPAEILLYAGCGTTVNKYDKERELRFDILKVTSPMG